MVDPWLPEAVATIFSFDCPWTYPPKVSEYPIGSETKIETDGFTLEGMEQVIVFVFDPMLVFPLYVVIVSVIETEVPVVFCFAKSSGGVHEMLVSLDFVQIVPDALPHVYVTVWVKLVASRVTVSV